MLKNNLFLNLLLSCGLATGTSYASDAYQILQPQSQIEFQVDSTLHKVKGKALSFSGEVSYDPETGSSYLPFDIEISLEALDTGNKKRDTAMRKMFHSEKYPSIKWVGEELKCSQPVSGISLCESMGTLEMNGVKHKIFLKAKLNRNREILHSKGTFVIHLDEFRLKPPSVLGLIKVSNEVEVQFDLAWRPVRRLS